MWATRFELTRSDSSPLGVSTNLFFLRFNQNVSALGPSGVWTGPSVVSSSIEK